MFVVDTNVLVYAADEDSPHHARCRALLGSWRDGADAWFVTWGILYEFLRVTTHPRVMRKPWTTPRAWEFLGVLLESQALEVLVPTERHAVVAARVIDEIPHLAGNLVHDAHTAILMREHGVRAIYTRDADFHRFPFIDPVDPLELGVGEARSPYRSSGARRRPAAKKRASSVV